MTTRWVKRGGLEVARDSWAPFHVGRDGRDGRCRLPQSRVTPPQMSETGGQQYTRVDPRTLEHHPPRTGGIYTPAPQAPRRRRSDRP